MSLITKFNAERRGPIESADGRFETYEWVIETPGEERFVVAYRLWRGENANKRHRLAYMDMANALDTLGGAK